MCSLETKLAVCSPQVPVDSRQFIRPAQVPWRELWQIQLEVDQLSSTIVKKIHIGYFYS